MDREASEAGFQRLDQRITDLMAAGKISDPLPPVVNDDCHALFAAIQPAFFADPDLVPPPGALKWTCTQSVMDRTYAALTDPVRARVLRGLRHYHGPVLIVMGTADPFGVDWVWWRTGARWRPHGYRWSCFPTPDTWHGCSRSGSYGSSRRSFTGMSRRMGVRPLESTVIYARTLPGYPTLTERPAAARLAYAFRGRVCAVLPRGHFTGPRLETQGRLGFTLSLIA